MFKSFSQYGEDKIINRLFISNNMKVRSFIDIGAHDGISLSNTFAFSHHDEFEMGISFEPTKDVFELLKNNYINNNKLLCFNYGISDEEKIVKMCRVRMSSFILETEDIEHNKRLTEEDRKNIINIQLKKFSFIEEITNKRKFDLLSIDVEGHEYNVIKSIDFSKFEFNLICCETHGCGKNNTVIWKNHKLDDIENVLFTNGYKLIGRNRLNSFYSKIFNNINSEVLLVGKTQNDLNIINQFIEDYK